jgi:hypothetical protein
MEKVGGQLLNTLRALKVLVDGGPPIAANPVPAIYPGVTISSLQPSASQLLECSSR